MKKIVLSIVLGWCFWIPGYSAESPVKEDETVLFFPTNAALDPSGQVWVIPVHGWIFEKEKGSFWRQMTLDSLAEFLEVEADDSNWPIYESRGGMFLVDNERCKRIEIKLAGRNNILPASEANGHFQGVIYRNRHIIDKQQHSDWISFKAITRKDDSRSFHGKVQLIGAKGLSVISDIDDTIKISNVKDKKALIKNTFLKEFVPVPGMAEVYRKWQQAGAVFHYLSASPWHLFPALSSFIAASGFPDGSYNLKNFRIKDETFFNLFSSQEDYKKPIVENLILKYPERKFILVGDAGEEDPEIFAKVARKYPEHVLHIFIRDLGSAGNQSQSERYQKTFAGIPEDRWSIFSEGRDLMEIDLAVKISGSVQ